MTDRYSAHDIRCKQYIQLNEYGKRHKRTVACEEEQAGNSSQYKFERWDNDIEGDGHQYQTGNCVCNTIALSHRYGGVDIAAKSHQYDFNEPRQSERK